jgi:hypothetical protein
MTSNMAFAIILLLLEGKSETKMTMNIIFGDKLGCKDER